MLAKMHVFMVHFVFVLEKENKNKKKMQTFDGVYVFFITSSAGTLSKQPISNNR